HVVRPEGGVEQVAGGQEEGEQQEERPAPRARGRRVRVGGQRPAYWLSDVRAHPSIRLHHSRGSTFAATSTNNHTASGTARRNAGLSSLPASMTIVFSTRK